MITNKEREFLQKILKGEFVKDDNPKKYSATMKRIQAKIDDNFKNLLWLVDNCPNVLNDEEAEIGDSSLERFRRFKILAYVTSKLDPMVQFENVDLVDAIKKLSQLYPKYYIELINKSHMERK